MVAQLDTHELAWAAGFFDGEGSTHVWQQTTPATHGRKRTYGPYAHLFVSVGQYDRECLERFQRAVGGLGAIYQNHKHRSGRLYSFQTGKFATSQAIIAMLWPWLSQPKRQQAAAALGDMREYHARIDRRRRGVVNHGD